jgi:hypothetical protein
MATITHFSFPDERGPLVDGSFVGVSVAMGKEGVCAASLDGCLRFIEL